MGPTIYASFETVGQAEKAMGALMDHGCKPEHLSLLASDGRLDPGRSPSEYDRTAVTTSTHSSVVGDPAYADDRNQPLRGDIGDMPIDADTDRGEIADTNVRLGGGAHPSRLGDTQYSAERPYSTDPSSGLFAHTMSVDEALEHTDRPRERTLADPAHPEVDGIESRGMEHRSEDSSHESPSGGGGITTTTGADAASGAVKGAGIGLGVGVLAALAAVFVPGVGLVVGGGALAAALAGAAATTAAGAAAGGVAGYLKDQGVPHDVLTRYNETIHGGGALIAVNPPESLSRAELEAVLAKYGALNVDTYGEKRAA